MEKSFKLGIYDEELINSLIHDYRTNPVNSLATLINHGALDGVNSLKNFTQINVSEALQLNVHINIYGEFLNFYNHLISRHIQAQVGTDGFDIEKKIVLPIFKLGANKIKSFDITLDENNIYRNLMKNFNEANEEYALTTSFAGKNYQDKTSTIYWFRQRVVHSYGSNLDFVQNMEIDSCVSSCYIAFMMMFDLSEWIKGPLSIIGYKSYHNIQLIRDT